MSAYRDGRFRVDLSLFAEDSPTGQKTEAATPWRRDEARRQGRAAKSIDLVATATLLSGFAGLYLFGSGSLRVMADYAVRLFGHLKTSLDSGGAMIVATDFLSTCLQALLPVFVFCSLGAILANVAQTGFLFSLEPLGFNIEKINPISGFQRLFSFQSVNETFKSILKISAVLYIPYRYTLDRVPDFAAMIHMTPNAILASSSHFTWDLSVRVLLLLLVIAILDYGYQYYEFEKSIMMSRYDIQQEMKQHEGDPRMKAALRRRRLQMAKRSLLKEVPKAAVVITNPTHFSIALQFERGRDAAPIVVAKGVDLIALKIREIARENDIPIVEEPPLARVLHERCEVGDLVPEELFLAVAEVLAFVFRAREARAEARA